MVPQWEGVFEDWSKGWVHRNGWRVKKTFGFGNEAYNDAMQQCAMVFSRCRLKYGDTVEEPRHFMALYKVAVAHHWFTLVRKQYAGVDTFALTPAVERQMSEEQVLPDGLISHVWESASEELRAVLTVISNAPSGLLQMLLDETSTDLNTRWKRLCGVETDRNLVEELRGLLS